MLLLSCWASAYASELPECREITTGAIPAGTPGEVRRYAVTSASLGGEVTVDVWTPEGYGADTSKSYPVIYAHDGQNLFDPTFTFAGVAWEMDRMAQLLANNGKIEAPIIVGINNRGSLRPCDYFPEKVLDYIPETERDRTKIFETCHDGFFGTEHAQFVATELKPLIDSRYRTNPNASHTFAFGSSMGGLASLYLLCEYPDIFGGAACLSTHWIGSLDLNSDYSMNDDPVCAQAILDYMNDNLPSPATHKLYLDQGTKGWDAGYLKYENTARQIAINHGYSTQEGTLMTYDAIGADHNEWFWQQRVRIPLEFMLDIHSLDAGVEAATNPEHASAAVYINTSGRIYTGLSPSELPPGVYIHNHRKLLIGAGR